MLKQNSELRAQAREALRGKWPMAAVAALIYSAIAGGLSSIPFIGWIGSLLVGLPVAYGFAILMLADSEERKKLIWECCLLDFRNIVVS